MDEPFLFPQYKMVAINKCQFCEKRGSADVLWSYPAPTFVDRHEIPFGIYIACDECQPQMEDVRNKRAICKLRPEIPSYFLNNVKLDHHGGKGNSSICCVRTSSTFRDDLVFFVHEINHNDMFGCVPFYFGRQSAKVRQFLILALCVSVPIEVQKALMNESKAYCQLFKVEARVISCDSISCDDIVFYNER